MAFRINPSPTFRAKVPLTVPGAEKRAVVEFEFRHKGRAQYAAWIESARGRNDAEALAEVIAGWSGVVDEQGADLPYSEEMLGVLIDRYPASALEILKGYHDALWEAREKN